jgi:hypothetical protein
MTGLSEIFSLQLRNVRADSEDMKTSFLDGKAHDTSTFSSKRGRRFSRLCYASVSCAQAVTATAFLFAAVSSSLRTYGTPKISIVVYGAWKMTVMALLPSEREEIWDDMAASVTDRSFHLGIERNGDVIELASRLMCHTEVPNWRAGRC